MVPIAISEEDGTANFYINQFKASSSLLPLNPEGETVGRGELLKVENMITVPTMRLDTFMNMVEIKLVEFLKDRRSRDGPRCSQIGREPAPGYSKDHDGS